LKKTGNIVIISSPSGGGKTSICQKLLNDNKNWEFSVSYTTRLQRPGEIDGREYYFVDEKKFDALKSNNFFAEHFKVHLYNYGTPRGPLENVLNSGGVILLDVDVQGAKHLKKEFDEALTIFILPPSVEELHKRLTARGTETEEQLKVRRENATTEMKLWHNFDYVVVNNELEEAVEQVYSIVKAHKCRVDKINMELINSIIS